MGVPGSILIATINLKIRREDRSFQTLLRGLYDVKTHSTPIYSVKHSNATIRGEGTQANVMDVL
jgi:hypothetical protein